MPQGDLFDNLPDPSTEHPTPAQAAPAPGSRRAAREAAQREAQQSESVAAPSADEDAPAAPPATTAHPVTVAASAPSAEEAVEPPRPVVTEELVAARPVGGSLEDLFAPEHHQDHAVPKRKRRTGCLVGLLIVLVLLGGIAAGGMWVWNTYGDRISDAMGWGEPKDYEEGEATGEALLTIEDGFTGQPISTALYEAGVTKTEDVFYDMLIAEGLNPTFHPGVYKLQQKMTAAAALEAIENPENRMENSVGVAEGSTLEVILPTIAETLEMPTEDLEAAVADPSDYGVAADTLEGWLFPAVYTFDPGVTATEVIQAMVDRTRDSLSAAGVSDEDAQEILTIASIIQREGRVADFDKVSRVIQNRLDDSNTETHGYLQMDSTAQYGYGELHAGSVATSEEAQHDDNPWNTYAHPGLPIGPISTSSDAAIDAAMHPADGPWLYFVTVNPSTGETVFTETYAEHQEAIKQWAQWCEDNGNPESGCSG